MDEIITRSGKIIEVVSVVEASEILGVSTRTIYTYLHTGRFRGARKTRGSQWAIPLTDVYDVIDNVANEEE